MAGRGGSGMIAFLFWLTLFLLVYPLFLYPLILGLAVRMKYGKANAGNDYAGSGAGRGTGFAGSGEDGVPHRAVSMLLSVYNEKEVIGEKIDNFLELEYPAERLELIVVSDGSDDGTDELAGEHVARRGCASRVTLLRQETRQGKNAALNLAAGRASGELLLFTDADSMLAPDSLALLARHFSDPDVGLASGRSVYVDARGRETAGSLYRRYEEWLKQREGRLFGIPGADGALYLMRRNMYSPLPREYIHDLLHPVQVALAGAKAVAEPAAKVRERDGEAGPKQEFARQTRIMAQSWLVFLRHSGSILREKRYGFFWQLASHKFLRWLTLPLVAALLPGAILLSGTVPFACLAGAVLFAIFARLGYAGSGGTPGRVAWLFGLQSAAAVTGLIRLGQGRQYVTWQPRGQ